MTTEKVYDASGHSLTVLNYRGSRLPVFPLESLRRLDTFVFRDDDILISAYPKSGTHWVWELCRMLQEGSTSLPAIEKDDFMIEMDVTDIPALPSPRILSTHLRYHQLPILARAACKLIYITRNPRDVAVSFYNHHVRLKQYYHYDGSWDDYFHLFVDGELDYGSWFDYTREWEQVLATQTHLPVLHLSYEDMKENPAEEVRRISHFLGKHHNKEFLQSVCDKCSFDSMLQRKGQFDVTPEGQSIMYRKGQVGDWRNWFTPEQVTRMEEVYRSKMAGSSLSFRYTLQQTTSSSPAASSGGESNNNDSSTDKDDAAS